MNRKKAAHALWAFLVVMVALTLIARVADSIMLPVVTAKRALPGALRHTIEMEGILVSGDERPVLGERDLPIGKISVASGQPIESGDALFAYDGAALRALLTKAQSDLKKLKLEMELSALDEPDGDQKATQADRQKKDLKHQITQIDIQAAQATIDRLTAIAAAGGVVTSPVSGVVGEVLARPGDCPSGAVMRIATRGEGLVLRASIDEEEMGRVRVGDRASYLLTSQTRYEDGATVVSLSAGADGFEATVRLPPDAGVPGQSASARVEKESASYRLIVPLGALTSQDGRDGVHLLRRRETVLGEQEYAEFCPVNVLERDLVNAAVEASLMNDDRVIASTTKPIKPGDRVRSKA